MSDILDKIVAVKREETVAAVLLDSEFLILPRDGVGSVRFADVKNPQEEP